MAQGDESKRFSSIGEGSVVQMMDRLMASLCQDVVHLFQGDKCLGGTILLVDDAALMNVLLHALVAPPHEIPVFRHRVPVIGGTARDEVVDGEELFLCHK